MGSMKNELLAKYILGEANTKEGQRVEQWLEESEDHQREFRQLKRRIELGSKRYKYGVFDPSAGNTKSEIPCEEALLANFTRGCLYHCFNIKRVMVLE